ncbi:MAG TPA: GNAT family N-acetyltransferase [Solirubrobacterales bacterium]
MTGDGVNESGQGGEVRSATPADVEAIERLVERAYGVYVERIGGKPGPMHHDYAERVAEAEVTVVADGDAIVGLLIIYLRDDHLLIENVAVDPEHQGRGMGGRLLDLAEDRARAADLEVVRLFTHERMTENIALYEGRGYREYERRDVRVFLVKELAE